jgi:protein-disulfide isomerase
MQQMQSFALTAIGQHKDKIFNDVNSPVAGNKNGDVILVEFFDYQCGHCKEMKNIVAQLMQKNPNLKVVFKEFPIFGENSEFAAKAAMAAALQGKYWELHEALLGAENPLTQDRVMKALQSLNLNVSEIQKNMNASNIVQELKNNYELAKSLKIMGTPAFIIANKDLTKFGYVPGATSEGDLQTQINAVLHGKNGPASPQE